MDGIQAQSPGWSRHGIPGCLAAHNALSSTASDPCVIGEWTPKQVLRTRGGQGCRGHLTCLSGSPGHAPVTAMALSSEDTLPLRSLPSAPPKGPVGVSRGSCSELSIQRESGEQCDSWIHFPQQTFPNDLLSSQTPHWELGIL